MLLLVPGTALHAVRRGQGNPAAPGETTHLSTPYPLVKHWFLARPQRDTRLTRPLALPRVSRGVLGSYLPRVLPEERA